MMAESFNTNNSNSHSSQVVPSPLGDEDFSVEQLDAEFSEIMLQEWNDIHFVSRTRLDYVTGEEERSHVVCSLGNDHTMYLDNAAITKEDVAYIVIMLQGMENMEMKWRDEYAVYIYSFDRTFIEFLISNVAQLTLTNYLDLMSNDVHVYAWKDYLYITSQNLTCYKIGKNYGEFYTLDQAAYMYDIRGLWVQDICAVVQESSKDYATSKYQSKEKNKRDAEKQSWKNYKEAKREFNQCPNSASKRKMESMKPKHSDDPLGVKPESSAETVASILEVLEKSGAMYVAFYSDKPLHKGLAALFTLIRGSVSVQAYNLMMSLVKDVKSESCTLGDFTNWLKLAIVDIEKFKNNKFAQSFFRLSTKIVSTFICPDIAGRVDELFQGNKIYDAIKSIFEGESSPLEVFTQFFTYILNAVDVFVKTGELSGFLETQTIDDEFISELRDVRDSFILFQNGNIEFVKDYKVYDFIRKMEKLLERMKSARKSRKSMELRELDRWIDELEKMKSAVAVNQIHQTAKIQGYYFSISSGSGISKSHLMKLFTNTIAAANNIPYGPDYTHNLNIGNKFQSGWKNNTTIVLVDDAAAMRETVTTAIILADWLLRASNNVPHELLGAGVDEKGVLFNRSLIECWSSNSFNMWFHKDARYSSALQRRFRCKIVGSVKEEFTKDTGTYGHSTQIDYSKMPLDMQMEIAPDAWQFDVRVVEIIDSGIQVKTKPGPEKEECDNDIVYPFKYHKGKRLQGISIDELLEFLIEDSKEHFKTQYKVLEMHEKLNNPDNYCEHGKPKCLKCNKCIMDRCANMNTPVITTKSLDFQTKVMRAVDLKNLRDSIFRGKRIADTRGEFSLPNFKPADVDMGYYGYFNKDALERTKFEFDGIVYNVTVNKGEMLFDPMLTLMTGFPATKHNTHFKDIQGVVGESARSQRVMVLKEIINLVKVNELNLDQEWGMIRDTFKLGKELREKLKNTLQTWFDKLSIDVILAIVDKVLGFVRDVFTEPWKYIPSMAEGTILGSYLHMKNPLYQLAMHMDYCSYQCQRFAAWQNGTLHFGNVKHQTYWAEKVWNRIRSRTQEEIRKEKVLKGLSYTEFAVKTGLYISGKEKEIKRENPDFIRDTMLPLIGLGGALHTFIPSFVRSVQLMYVEEEMGVSVPVDKIEELDKEERVSWYKNRQETMRNEIPVNPTINFTELENKLRKNTVNLYNIETGERTGGFSPRNQFILVPWHFARSSFGKVIRVVKVSSKVFSPGNAYVEFPLTQSMVTKLPGDAALIHVSKLMDHLQTKDMMQWFPDALTTDPNAGRLIWKDGNGDPHMFDLSEIEYRPNLNTEDLGPGDVAKDPFQGYTYSFNTFNGLCGAVLVDHSHKKSHIMGFHVGGVKSSNVGVSVGITRGVLLDAMESIKYVKQESELNLTSYGIELLNKDVYHKNPAFDTVDRLDDVEVIGTVDKRITPVAKVVQTPISNAVITAFSLDQHWEAPAFKFKGDKRHGVRSLYRALSKKNTLKHTDLLSRAVSDYRECILRPINKNRSFWKKELVFLSDFEVVNGTGKRFVSSMNMSTKFDAHMPGTKAKHATQYDDGHWEFNKYVMDEFRLREAKMGRGELTYELLVQSLKNEPTLKSKVEAGKVRNFFMCGTPFQMIMRKYLLTTCRYFCLTSSDTECSVGINPHSMDWDRLWKSINVYRNLIALDFKNFDLTTLYEVLEKALDLLFTPVKEVGNNSEKSDNVMMVIKHSILHCLCDVSGDVMILRGIIPSGVSITSIVGCITNSLNFRMAYYFLDRGAKLSFQEVVCLRTFGDDAIGSTKDKRMSVKNLLYAFSQIGIYATDASKNVESKVTFYSKEDLEFLKRGFRWDKDFGAYVAPLAESSRFKMLCCHLPTKYMSIEELTGQCIDNFLMESTFHGRKQFNKDMAKIKAIVTEYNLGRFCKTLDESFDCRVKSWKDKYRDGVLDTSSKEKGFISSVRLALSDFWSSNNWFEWTQEFENKHTCELVSKLEDVEARAEEPTNKNPHVSKRVGTDIPTFIVPESTKNHEVLTYLESEEEQVKVIGGPLPEARTELSDCNLGNFLSRPVKIAEFAWGNVVFANEFDPWNALFTNERIANRICNYKLFRGKVHVKFVLNGNGFYYGRLMCSYLPFASSDRQTQQSPLVGLNRIPMSQCQKVFLDPTTSESVSMVLPFFYPADYVDLQGSNVDRELGRVLMYQIATLRHANQDIAVSGTQVSVSVYAWFEDVELEGPTHANLQGVTPQSEREEETSEKPVSQAATSIANAASYVAKVPIIGKYATAVEKGAVVASSVASAMGYCRPVDVREPERYLPRPIGGLATANTSDTSIKLSLDVKQEISIDPNIVGLSSEDELSIAKIAGTDSYLTNFSWSTDQFPEDFLWNVKVTPTLASSNGDVRYMTAVCGASLPFQYWTGSLIFRFQVISSAYHKGRLAITYDPNNAPQTREDNVSYTEIIDISKNRDFELTINNFQDRQWLEIDSNWLLQDQFGTTRLTNSEGSNGVLSVFVLNELTTPSADPTIGNLIEIAVYVRAGDNFQLANPGERLNDVSINIVPESSTDEIDSTLVAQGHGMNMPSKQSKAYIGEVVESFRMLLKRYVGYCYITYSGSSFSKNFTHPGFPEPNGHNGGVPLGPGNANVVGHSYIAYLISAFSGWKGSIRWKASYAIGDETEVYLSRRDVSAPISYFSGEVLAPSDADKALAFKNGVARASYFGASMSSSDVNPVLEVEIPFYSEYKFIAGKTRDMADAKFLAYTQYLESHIVPRSDTQTISRNVSLFVAAGEDFTCHYFTGWPPLTITS